MAGVKFALFLAALFSPLVFIPFFVSAQKQPRAKLALAILKTAVQTFAIFCLWHFIPFKLSIGALEFSVTNFSFALAGSVSICTLFIMLYNLGHKYIGDVVYDIFFCILLSALIGSIFASNLLTIYIFLDFALFAGGYLLYTIRTQVKIAYQYVLLNLLGSGLILFFMILYSSETGGYIIQQVQLSKFALFGLIVGMMIKAGLVPLHIWAPPSYSKSVIPVASALAGGLNAAVLYALYKFLPLLPASFLFLVGALSLLYGSMFALLENEMRKSLAYISIAESGLFVCALAIGAIAGALYLILAAMLAKTSLFLLAGLLERAKGLTKRNFYIALFGFLTACFSIIGLPGTAGFVAHLNILYTALKIKQYIFLLAFVLANILLLASLLKLYTYLTSSPYKRNHPRPTLAALIILSLVNITLGLAPFIWRLKWI